MLPALPEGRLCARLCTRAQGDQRAAAVKVCTEPSVCMILSQQKAPCCVGWSRGWEREGIGHMGLRARGRHSPE